MTQSGTLNAGQNRSVLDAIVKRGEVSAADVAGLRREIFVDGAMSRQGAEALFAIERATIEKCPEWIAFFAETITEHAVWQARPTGVVNEDQAQWLIAQADQCRSIGALAVLVDVLVEADRVPGWLPEAVRARTRQGWAGVDEALHVAEAA
jgi:hypothetical protein